MKSDSKQLVDQIINQLFSRVICDKCNNRGNFATMIEVFDGKLRVAAICNICKFEFTSDQSNAALICPS